MSQHSTPPAAADSDNEASTVDMTRFETVSVSRLKQLSEGDTVAVRYNSAYSDGRQMLEGEVTRTEFEDRDSSDFTGATVYIAPEGEDNRDAYYRKNLNRPPRRIDGYDDGDLNTFTLETRNGARWHQLSRGATPEIKLDGTTEGEGQ
jgi:hypothetical protein